jgi:hypothetical protein
MMFISLVTNIVMFILHKILPGTREFHYLP